MAKLTMPDRSKMTAEEITAEETEMKARQKAFDELRELEDELEDSNH